MNGLAKVDDAWTREQIIVLKDTVARGVSNAEFELFREVCRSTGLSPFARQIYAISRKQWDPEKRESVAKMTIQTSVDGLRLIAERTGKYAGQGMFEWCGPDGVWKDVWLSSTAPLAARASVYRKDWTVPLVRVALLSAYQQNKKDGGPTEMWSGGKAVGMLAKCAEALALRAAFPQELSGLYTGDEMSQADDVRATVIEQQKPTHQNGPTPQAPRLPAPQEQGEVAPRFSPGFKAGDGGLLSEASGQMLGDYISYLEGKKTGYINNDVPDALTKALEDAQWFLDGILEAEARKAEEAAAVSPPVVPAKDDVVHDAGHHEATKKRRARANVDVAGKLQADRDAVAELTTLDPNDHSYLDGEVSP